MTRTQRHPRPTPTQLATIDLDDLAVVHGGVNWRFHMYRAAGAISKWDPSMVAASLIM